MKTQMKVSFLAILFLFSNPLLGFTGVHADGGTYGSPTPCPTKLIVDTSAVRFPFNITTLSCSTAWRTRDFILMYQQTGPNLWNYVLSAPENNAYIAIGFSSNGKMVGSSAIVGWVSSAGIGVAKQYFLGGQSPSQCPPNQGFLQLTQGPFIASQSWRLFLAFQLSTAQPQTKLLYAIGPQGTLPGPDNYISEHHDRVSTTINYATGQTSYAWSTLQKVHGSVSLGGWGVLLPIGMLVARYCKHWDPLWLYAHASIQVLGFASGIAGVVTGFILEGQVGDNVNVHKGIGIGILALGTLQVTAVVLRPKKESKLRKYWNWYHHGVGRLVIALAIGNIFYGLSLAGHDTSWFIGYGAFLGLWLFVCVALEVLMRLKKK